MKDRTGWNRRDFMKAAGCASLGARFRPWLMAGEMRSEGMPRFAFVGTHQGIDAFTIVDERWKPIAGIRTGHPTFVALPPSQRFLYAIQKTDHYEHLPRGVVDAYEIHPTDGSLTLLNRQPLSLSAISPQHGAVSPDGNLLVVAVHGGGAYNVLPINADGSLGRVAGILKETGSAQCSTAHPQMVMFDPAGRHFLGADSGTDRLSVFALGEGRIKAVERVQAQAGSGPRHMELHPNGRLLFVAGGLDGTLSCYRYDAQANRLLEPLQHVRANATFVAIHTTGRFLYTASDPAGVMVWRIDPTTGALRPIQDASGASLKFDALVMTADGGSLLGLSRNSDSVFRWRIDRIRGRLSRSARVAQVPSPMSLACKYA